MMSHVKKIVVAIVLLLGMTGLSLAQEYLPAPAYGAGYYDYSPSLSPSYGASFYDYSPGYTGYGGPWNYSGTPSGQPSPSSGIEAYR